LSPQYFEESSQVPPSFSFTKYCPSAIALVLNASIGVTKKRNKCPKLQKTSKFPAYFFHARFGQETVTAVVITSYLIDSNAAIYSFINSAKKRCKIQVFGQTKCFVSTRYVWWL